MTDLFTVRLYSGDLERELLDLGRRAPLIMARSLNRAGTTGRAAMARAVSKDAGLKVGTVKKEIRLDKANQTRLAVTVEIKGRRIPLIAFGARGPEPSRGKGRGVSYRIGGSRKRIRQAFIATMPSGHRGVFVRKPGARHKKGPPRHQLPIIEKFGPSLPHVFEKQLPVLKEAASDSLEKNLRREINFGRIEEGA